MKICVVNQKGGVGKSSVTFLLACCLREAGKSVYVLDLDPQKSVTAWLSLSAIENEEQADYFLIDTPPNLFSKEAKEAIQHSDKVLIPVTPNFADLEVTQSTLPRIREIAPKADILLVWNKVQKGTVEARQTSDYDEALGIASSRQQLSQRICYSRIPQQGWKVLDAASKAEVVNLALEITA